MGNEITYNWASSLGPKRRDNMIQKLSKALSQDGLTFKKLARYCEVEYRMNFNPLPAIRKYISHYRVDIPIHYIETGHRMDRDDVLNKVCGRAVPLIVIIAQKKEGYCVHVDMRIVTLDAHKVDPDGVIWYI